MPRGSDADQAAVDLRGQYGLEANAEQMIRQHRLSITPQQRAAMNIAREELSEDDRDKLLKKLDGKVGDGQKVLDAAVRGSYVVAVVEVESGRTFKQVFQADDLGVEQKGRSRGALVEESDEQKAEREEQEAHLRVVAKAAEAERAAQEAAEKARQEKLAELEKDKANKAKSSGKDE